MVIEILFNEVCGLYGDSQNPKYLESTLPEATFVYTPLTDVPYFVDHPVDMLYMGAMSEEVQRQVINKLLPYHDRIIELVDNGVPFLATGNAGEIFARRIDYITEEITVDGLGLFDLTVKTNLFDRFNGKVLGKMGNMTVVGFRSQFSFLYGDNSKNYFLECARGCGINRDSKLEGMRRNNLICTQLIGPILPLNPMFCEYFISLAGVQATAAHREAAMDAYEQRVKEFSDEKVVFGRNM